MNSFIKILISFLVLSLLGSSYLDSVFGQSIDGNIPLSQYPVYVLIPTAGFSATQISTKRVRQGKSEYIDIINVLADITPFMEHASMTPGLALNAPFYEDQLLVTMALLPNKSTGFVAWEPIEADTLKNKPQVALNKVLQDCYARLFAYKAAQPYVNAMTRRLDFRPVILRDGRYWTTHNTVLTEYFLVRGQPLWFLTGTDNVTINYHAQPFPRSEFYALKQRLTAAFPTQHDRPLIEGELQTKMLLEKKEGQTYFFWSIPPRVSDADITCFGAVDLQFREGIGIISGKYPDYFDLASENTVNTFFEVISIKPLTAIR